MTQEEKQLLIKDLCARLPYGVKINIYDYSGAMKDEELNVFHLNSTYNIEYRKLRPYLRPMSSMTEKEREEEPVGTTLDGYMSADEAGDYIDWLLEHHFDYNELIPMGLALEAPDGMYKKEIL